MSGSYDEAREATTINCGLAVHFGVRQSSNFSRGREFCVQSLSSEGKPKSSNRILLEVLYKTHPKGCQKRSQPYFDIHILLEVLYKAHPKGSQKEANHVLLEVLLYKKTPPIPMQPEGRGGSPLMRPLSLAYPGSSKDSAPPPPCSPNSPAWGRHIQSMQREDKKKPLPEHIRISSISGPHPPTRSWGFQWEGHPKEFWGLKTWLFEGQNKSGASGP